MAVGVEAAEEDVAPPSLRMQRDQQMVPASMAAEMGTRLRRLRRRKLQAWISAPG